MPAKAAETLPTSPSSKAQSWESLFAGVSTGKTIVEVAVNRNIFVQGEHADSVFYLRRGTVKLAVTSEAGRGAVFGIAEAGELFGEGCLAVRTVRMATASALTDCTLVRIEKVVMTALLRQHHALCKLLVMHLLRRNVRYEEDLVYHIFNTSEQRLARSLLLLAHFGEDGGTEAVQAKFNQATLAQMIGTTRSRVNQFMNKFRQDGLVEYDSQGTLVVSGKLQRLAGNCSHFAASTNTDA